MYTLTLCKCLALREIIIIIWWCTLWVGHIIHCGIVMENVITETIKETIKEIRPIDWMDAWYDRLEVGLEKLTVISKRDSLKLL